MGLKVRNAWDWQSLSKNEGIRWSLKLLKKFGDKWNWDSIMKNDSIEWNAEMIDSCKDNLDWDLISANTIANHSLGFLKMVRNAFESMCPSSVSLILECPS